MLAVREGEKDRDGVLQEDMLSVRYMPVTRDCEGLSVMRLWSPMMIRNCESR